MHEQVHVCTPTYMCTCKYICACKCVCVCVCMCLFIYILLWVVENWTKTPESRRLWFQLCLHLLCCCLVVQSCLTLCDPMDCSTSGFPVLHHLPELAQAHAHWVGDAIQPSRPLSPSSICLQSFPESGSFLMRRLFPSGGQRIGISDDPQSFWWIFRMDFL